VVVVELRLLVLMMMLVLLLVVLILTLLYSKGIGERKEYGYTVVNAREYIYDI